MQKPPGVLTHRSELAPDDDVMMTRVRDLLGEWVFPVHRLDRQTSGALVFARSEEAARRLRQAFDEGRVEKTYLAVVRGVFPDEILVDHPVPKREGGPRVPAVTWFSRRETRALPGHEGASWSLVEARPKTGRFHQIRRHAAHLRHPLAVDSQYGTGWFNRAVRALGLPRLALHASAIAIPDLGWDDAPARVVEAPTLEDWDAALGRLRG